MSIQWFPGHMTRARRQIEEKLPAIDLIFELLDARMPVSSRNPLIRDITSKKPRLVLLNKIDLADPVQTERWVKRMNDEGVPVLPINSTLGDPSKMMTQAVDQTLKSLKERWASKNMQPRAFRALVVGIPNVGKSTLINRLAKRQVAATGDRPGITKAQKWIKVSDKLELLDTPGVLWPKFDDQLVGFVLAATGSIKDEILPIEEVAHFVIQFFQRVYPERLAERFSVTLDQVTEMEPADWWELIGRKRGCLASGGVVDYEKTARAILNELRSGKWGRYTFDLPNEL